jgi:hypothetical protein
MEADGPEAKWLMAEKDFELGLNIETASPIGLIEIRTPEHGSNCPRHLRDTPRAQTKGRGFWRFEAADLKSPGIRLMPESTRKSSRNRPQLPKTTINAVYQKRKMCGRGIRKYMSPTSADRENFSASTWNCLAYHKPYTPSPQERRRGS